MFNDLLTPRNAPDPTDLFRIRVDGSRRHGKSLNGLQAELLSGFETYVPMSGGRLCFHDTYCRYDDYDHMGH